MKYNVKYISSQLKYSRMSNIIEIGTGAMEELLGTIKLTDV